MKKYRVIHCGTGLAGKEALKAIIEHPEMELAGLLVHSAKNAGLDAGHFAGTAATGVLATDKLEDILALEADAVCHMLLLPDEDLICKLLASGKNVVSTAGLISPGWHDPALQQRIEAACAEGGSTFYVTGINPGFVNEILPLAMSSLCRDIRRIHISEYGDCSTYDAPQILDLMGFGKSEAAAMADQSLGGMRRFFAESVAALARGLGLKLDDIRETREFVLARQAYDLKALHIPAGTIAGQRWRWSGIADGEARIVKDTYWVTAFDLGEGWPGHDEMDKFGRWDVTIEGTPSLRCKFERGFSYDDPLRKEAYNPAGLATAMIAVNSLIPVCAAAPGPVNSMDLHLPRMRRAMS